MCEVLTTAVVGIVGKIAALSLIPLSCLAATFKEYPTRPAIDCAVSAERAGFVIGVQPVEDLKEQETYFHTKLSSKGFIPIFIVLQNASSGDSFLFDKARVTYGPSNSSVSTPEARSKAGEGVAVGSLAAVSLAGAIDAVKLMANASQVQQNILKSEVQSKTLSPGGSEHGFLYVPAPKKGPREKIHLRVPITRAGTDETFVLDLVF